MAKSWSKKQENHGISIQSALYGSQLNEHKLVGGLNPSEKYESIGMIIPFNGKLKNVPNHQPIFLTLQGTLVRLPLAGFLSLEESLGPPEPGWARMATISMQKTSENHDQENQESCSWWTYVNLFFLRRKQVLNNIKHISRTKDELSPMQSFHLPFTSGTSPIMPIFWRIYHDNDEYSLAVWGYTKP